MRITTSPVNNGFKLFFTVFSFWIITNVSFSIELKAQVNIAPNATITSVNCTGGACWNLNNGNTGVCGTPQFNFLPSANNPLIPGNIWIEWNWTEEQFFNEIIIHNGFADNRILTGATIQYWNGQSWQNHHTFSNLPLQCENSVPIPPLITNRFRITSFTVEGVFQDPNASLREIEIIGNVPSNNDAGVYSLVAPKLFCPGQEDVVVRVFNYGNNPISQVTVNWTINGIPQPPITNAGSIDTAGGTNSSYIDVLLGSHNFLPNTAYELVAWTSMPNNVIDAQSFNDTLKTTLFTSMSGTYSINANVATGGANFQSFTDFAHYLNNNGVCGPVVANVAVGSGPYTERLRLNNIEGTSPTNTITINGNGNTLSFAGNFLELSTVALYGTSHLTIDSLNMEATGSTHGWVLFLGHQSDSNTIRNCSLQTSITSVDANFCNIAMALFEGSTFITGTSSSNANYNTFENNVMIGGLHGVYSRCGVNLPANKGNVIRNCSIQDFQSTAITFWFSQDLIIEKNVISRFNRMNINATTAIYLSQAGANARITENIIHHLFPQNLTITNPTSVLTIANANNSQQTKGLIANNLVYNINSMGNITSLNFTGSVSSYWDIYHNTFVLDSLSGSATGNTILISFPNSSSSNFNVKNNLFYLDRGSTGNQRFFSSGSLNSVDFNNNAYFSSNPIVNLATVSGTPITTFANWQLAGNDIDGVFLNPNFQFTPHPYQATSPNVLGIGTNLTQVVPEDILAVQRPTNPDPGVYQTPAIPGIDLAINQIIIPVSPNVCQGANPVEIEVGSFALDTATGFTVEWWVNGIAQPPVVHTGSILPGSTNIFSLGTINVNLGVLYNIQARITQVLPTPDIDTTNNSAVLTDIAAGLEGVYTINQGAPASITNFPSFNDAAQALNDFGVCGSVEINVVPQSGPYAEQVMFERVRGTSVSNTVTINGNGNTLSYLSTNTDKRYTLGLNQVDYFTIDSLVIIAEGRLSGEFARGVWITNNSNNNTISHCKIMVDTLISNSSIIGVVINNSATLAAFGDAGRNNTIKNNEIKGGQFGIVLNESQIDTLPSNNKILNNRISDFNTYGIYGTSLFATVIKGNDVTRGNRIPSSGGLFYGFHFTGNTRNIEVVGNHIHHTCQNCTNNTSAQYGMHIQGMSLSHGISIIANNIISDFNGGGNQFGISLGLNNVGAKVFHNTITIDTTGFTSNQSCGIVSGSNNSSVEIFNNIISNTKLNNAFAFCHNTARQMPASNYNAIYVPHGEIASHGNFNNYSTISDWQSRTGNDVNAVLDPPRFLDPSAMDYTPGTGAHHQKGTNLLSYVPNDFFDSTRTITPDLGAIEYSPPPCSGPYNLVSDSLTPTSGFFTWESLDSNWVIEYGIMGFSPGVGMGFQSVASSSTLYEITGLQSNFCYDVYVAELCGNDTSVWAGPVSICTPKANDAVMIGVASPKDLDCGDVNTPLKVEIFNNGFFPITTADITLELSGTINQTFNFTYIGNLASGESTGVTIANLDLSLGAFVEILAYITIPNDQNRDNDSVRMDSVRVVPESPQFDHFPFCKGNNSITLFGVPFGLPYGGFEWYTSDTGQTPFSFYDTVQIAASMLPDVWITYQKQSFRDFIEINTCSPGIFSSCNNGDYIDNFSTTGGRTKDISNLQSACSSGSYGDFSFLHQVDAKPGDTIFFTVQSNPVFRQGYRLWIDWNNDGAFDGIGEDVWRSDSSSLLPITGQIIVPLSAPKGMKRMRIRSNFNDVPTSPCDNQAYGETEDYTFEVLGENDCLDNRVQVNVATDSAVSASFTYRLLPNLEVEFINTSTPDSTSASWDFDGIGTATGDTVSFTFPQYDTVTVCLTASNSCSTDDYCLSINLNEFSVTMYSINNYKLFPNPNKGKFVLSFEQNDFSDLQLELLDLSGKVIFLERHTNFRGAFYKEISLDEIASGAYMLRIANDRETISKRVIISK
ncbi:MAG: T9SS type A sorting domain-containing protein [Cryomorphaceae bacterium]|nr:T9SS type A sorting domain-containing protein [Cryomorphaceae bacterium]